jgi:hypothetical protein
MIEISGYIYTLEDGQWLHKAKDAEPLNTKGALKPKYRDLPRFKAIYQIEKNMNMNMAVQVKGFISDAAKLLKKISEQ